MYHLVQENSVIIKIIIYSRDFENVNQSHQVDVNYTFEYLKCHSININENVI